MLTLIRTSGWPCEYEHRDVRSEVPPAAADLFARNPDDWLRCLPVWPVPDMEVTFRPGQPDYILGDVNLSELQGQDRLNEFCGFLRRLGQALNKRVAMLAEGGDNYPILAYEVDQDRVSFLAGPR